MSDISLVEDMDFDRFLKIILLRANKNMQEFAEYLNKKYTATSVYVRQRQNQDLLKKLADFLKLDSEDRQRLYDLALIEKHNIDLKQFRKKQDRDSVIKTLRWLLTKAKSEDLQSITKFLS